MSSSAVANSITFPFSYTALGNTRADVKNPEAIQEVQKTINKLAQDEVSREADGRCDGTMTDNKPKII
jgi:hypothetical protein